MRDAARRAGVRRRGRKRVWANGAWGCDAVVTAAPQLPGPGVAVSTFGGLGVVVRGDNKSRTARARATGGARAKKGCEALRGTKNPPEGCPAVAESCEWEI